jgi:hypothetical protein
MIKEQDITMSNGYYADLPLRDKNIECSIRYLSKTTKLGMWSILN